MPIPLFTTCRFSISVIGTSSKGQLDKIDEKFMMTEIVIEPVLTIAFEADLERAIRTLNKSEAACLITNSIKSTVTMRALVKTLMDHPGN